MNAELTPLGLWLAPRMKRALFAVDLSLFFLKLFAAVMGIIICGLIDEAFGRVEEQEGTIARKEETSRRKKIYARFPAAKNRYEDTENLWATPQQYAAFDVGDHVIVRYHIGPLLKLPLILMLKKM